MTCPDTNRLIKIRGCDSCTAQHTYISVEDVISKLGILTKQPSIRGPIVERDRVKPCLTYIVQIKVVQDHLNDGIANALLYTKSATSANIQQSLKVPECII